jgi:heptaprenyl diphosphate synthase
VVLLGAFCLFLATLEYLIPKPLPFIRIGLANLPLLLALDLLSPRYFGLLVLIKIAGAGIVSGTIFSYVFLFSLSGSLASALVMYGLRRLSAESRRLSLAGIGVAGAMCSSGAQLFLARFLVFGEGIRYLIPPFLAMSLLSGGALGLFCGRFCRRSRWYQGALGAGFTGPAQAAPGEGPTPLPRFSPAPKNRGKREARRLRWDRCFRGPELIIAGLVALLLFLFNPSTLGRSLQFLFFWFCAWLSGRNNRPLITLSVIAGVALVNLLVPYGRVLAEFGPLHITAGSLLDGLRKGITLEGLLMLSSTVIRVPPPSGVSAPSGAGGGIPVPSGPALFRRAALFGRFLGESLSIFAVLRESGGSIRPAHFIDDVDSLLVEMAGRPVPVGGGERGEPPGPARRRLVLGLLITAALALLPLLLSRRFGLAL